ncbi:hypothetical protein CKO13_00155 [Halorhodospira neutriphila]|uniref:FAD dependent oxidoreductase domain-containing protein n=2 Tax=Halorhodospira neutriphila TaxID=168379 RepID=A0ABS1E2J8_9GAMM|nr:hypothetical protein [Halorhodospira neutriphila]
MIHLLDICDYFYGSTPIHTWKEPFRNSAHLFVAYQNGATGEFTLGWHTENTKKRWLEIFYDSASLHLDFINNEVALKKNSDKFEKFCLKKEQTSIRDQILNFINAIDQRESLRTTFNNAKTVLKATGIDKKINKTKKHKPRVAVIGGGVFGATSAIELAKFCDVDLIEKNKSLMNESSYLNQWRHHSGFHYPLSFETAQEIKETKKEFESIFQEAIKYSYTSYYLVSSYAREIPAERYLSACNLYNLNYRITPPPRHLKDGSTSVCLETDEGIYDIPKMQEIIEKNIQKNCNIRKLLSTEVTSGKIKKDSTKTIYLQNSHSCWKNDYDFVINCTYANLGLIIDYLSLPQIDLRIEEVELLEIEADIDDICLTIIDGPFISLTSMGHENKFLLSHRDHSVRRRLKTHDLTSPVSGYVTKTDSYSNILSAAKEYIPALAEAKYIQSWISYKAIQNQTNNFWNRPTLIHNHGFGVWSLLGGKILTSVTNAKEVAEHIKRSKLNV